MWLVLLSEYIKRQVISSNIQKRINLNITDTDSFASSKRLSYKSTHCILLRTSFAQDQDESFALGQTLKTPGGLARIRGSRAHTMLSGKAFFYFEWQGVVAFWAWKTAQRSGTCPPWFFFRPNIDTVRFIRSLFCLGWIQCLLDTKTLSGYTPASWMSL